MNNPKLIENQAYVDENIERLREIYMNKYLLVYEKAVVGSFDTYEAAASEGVSLYGTDGSFLVYHVTELDCINFISPFLYDYNAHSARV